MAPRVVLRPPDLGVDEAVGGLMGEGQLARGWQWGIQAPLWSMHEVALRPMSVFRRGRELAADPTAVAPGQTQMR